MTDFRSSLFLMQNPALLPYTYRELNSVLYFLLAFLLGHKLVQNKQKSSGGNTKMSGTGLATHPAGTLCISVHDCPWHWRATGANLLAITSPSQGLSFFSPFPSESSLLGQTLACTLLPTLNFWISVLFCVFCFDERSGISVSSMNISNKSVLSTRVLTNICWRMFLFTSAAGGVTDFFPAFAPL